jgi:preprotein translocase SecE subunit
VASTKKTPASATKVTKITASDSATSSKAKKATSVKPVKQARKSNLAALRPFIAAGRYFKGAWVELQQVRWPTRQATWGLTGAVLAFTAFFVALILLLDAAFKFLFETILK